ncbi:MAG: APC family permease [Candidatus Nanopelagicales bacterium]|nr:APC family permease [Candidatus Nanopelagicales bacterium]
MKSSSRAGGTSPADESTNVGLMSAAALGVGGMMGAGLYTLLGQAAAASGTWLPVAFLLGALVASLSVYSYARFGAKFPSDGGAAQMLVQGLGRTTWSGGLNVFQFFAYLAATALYAAGFGEYVLALGGDALPSWANQAAGIAVVAMFTLVNMISTKLVGRAESLIVGVEIAILIALITLGIFKADPSLMSSQSLPGGPVGIVVAAALLYVTYQGFGVVANASGSMRRPGRELPRAMFLSLAIVTVIYLAISTLVVMLLPVGVMETDAGHVLANVGQAIAGRAGFVAIAIAALLATSSAVNATLFAASNVGRNVAENRQLSAALTATLWRNGSVALVGSGITVVILVLVFPLSAIGQLASLGFLLVYASVSLSHLRVRRETHAKRSVLIAAIVANMVLFTILLAHTIRSQTSSAVALAVALIGSFVFEWLYRRRLARRSSSAS